MMMMMKSGPGQGASDTMTNGNLANTLTETWARQGRDGFLLSDPASAEIETKIARDPATGAAFRFRWMPHREIRGDVKELENRGIMNPRRGDYELFADPRDPHGRHCFLCERNIRVVHPMEELVPIEAGGRTYLAGANFAWIEFNHYTIMDKEHTDQRYSRQALQAAVDLHRQTGGAYRVLFNGPGAGASIPWHFHFQVTTEAMPIETVPADRLDAYPTAVRRFVTSEAPPRRAAAGSTQHDGNGERLGHGPGIDEAHAYAEAWINRDPEHHTVNLLIATPEGESAASLWIFLRDQRRAKAEGKGLVGGFEVAGDFVLSAPNERPTFDSADASTARRILEQIRPDAD